MKRFYLSFALLALSAFLFSCSSTTMITSEPPNADTYVNGEYIGKTPVPYRDSRIVFSENTVMLKKQGYQNYYDIFVRDEEPQPAAIIAGCIFPGFWLWGMQYKSEHHYKLEPSGEQDE